ncbi:MAG TPA: prolyl oligopeptidase family serine peptidase [Longimicrobiales bacterium]|nr:prolyl oligopeptidase family serine peptidase [Longimicrobiales bacterium]
MTTLLRSASLLVLATLFLGDPASARQSGKRPLDHDAYELWDTIGGPMLSRDGRWALYSLIRQTRDGELRIQELPGATSHAVPRAASPRFSRDSRYVVFLIKPTKEAVDQARRERRRPDQMPRDSLGIVDLATGQVTRIEHVRSFAMPEDASGWLAYHLERAPAEGQGGGGQGEGQRAAAGGQGQGGGRPANGRTLEEGSPLVIRNLATGEERRIESVTSYVFSKDGRRLAYAVSTRDGEGNGVYLLDPATGSTTPLLTGKGVYRNLTFDEAGNQVAFLSNRDHIEDEQPQFTLYHWRASMAEARAVAAQGTPGIPAGWWVSEYGQLSFSQDGRRLFFGTAPRPEPEVQDDTPEDQRVRVDIWHWQDPLIQPMQLRQLEQTRRRNYRAVVHLRDNYRVVQLADEDMPRVDVPARGNADLAIGISNVPYQIRISWDSPNWVDVYVVDVRTGRRERVLQEVQVSVQASPGGRYATWWDPNERAWFAMELASRRIVNLTAAIPVPLYNEEHDHPMAIGSYGSAGWTTGDAAFLVYDRYDIWATDPSGRTPPRNITEGVGRREGLRLRYVRLDPDEQAIDPARPMLLSAFHYRNKQAGFFRDRVQGDRHPERLMLGDYAFSDPLKARDADVLLYTRQTFQEFPDLWVADLDFSAPRKISNANPQQSEYLWGTAELVEWHTADGQLVQGILYKPEDFDPSRKYPMITYFYERMSDGLHLHYPPVPHRSRINFTMYTSRGYLVFVPDIPYKIGYPGESAMHAVMPGVLKLLERGYVDRDALGLQGHSWGGYQIAYMVTRTNLFKAAAPGALVANMFSAYGGIRWESGMSRQFQYERTQSRIGGSIWEKPLQFLENSPIFWADKIETPLLMMHNDQDGAVPWYQGIEMYLALRRLGKPAWLVNYNGEPHWPTTYANKRDWNIRMQQFFDHFLKGAPPPVWLAEGIPAVKKGRTLGLELVEEPVRADAGGNDNR